MCPQSRAQPGLVAPAGILPSEHHWGHRNCALGGTAWSCTSSPPVGTLWDRAHLRTPTPALRQGTQGLQWGKLLASDQDMCVCLWSLGVVSMCGHAATAGCYGHWKAHWLMEDTVEENTQDV